MEESDRQPQAVNYFTVLWRQRRVILVGSACLAFLGGLAGFFVPKVWEVDAIFEPGRLLIETREGRLEEFYVADPRQIAGQINQHSYDSLIADQLKLDLRRFPEIRAENLRDSKLIRFSIRDKDTGRAKAILGSLFVQVKKQLDDTVDVERERITAAISTLENQIKQKQADIGSREIAIESDRQDIRSLRMKEVISQERMESITQEMKGVKVRIDQIEKQQQAALYQTKESKDAVGLLLYSNEIQQNLRYYNSLEERLSAERITQENLKQDRNSKEREIGTLKAEIEKLNREIDIARTEIDVQNARTRMIRYAQMVKEPTSTLNPVSAGKGMLAVIAGLSGLILFSLVFVSLDYLNRTQKPQE